MHNTQPWRFTVTEQAIELYADPGRQLLEDPAGREMIISCGAALLARVRAGRPAPMTSDKRAMLKA